jgi:hypothetical protein
MPLIIPSNSISAGGFAVDNSLRFNDGSSDYLNFSPSSTSSRRIFTISFWFKQTNSGTTRALFSTGDYSGGDGYLQINLSSSGRLVVDDYDTGGDSYNLRWVTPTSFLFRDPGAWMHFVLAVDSTQGTQSNRVKVYINGVDISSDFTQTTSTSENDDFHVNTSGKVQQIGRSQNNDNYYDGYLAEFVMIDGQQLDPTSFGEFDEDTGIWKPISVSGLTFGTNGFYLDFENSGSLGADVSGNGNNFTVNNLTAIDQTTDTCTNNYATLNPLDNYYASSTFSEGNCKIVTSSGNMSYNTGTIAVSQGKWYVEAKVVDNADSNYHHFGIAETPSTSTSNWLGVSATHYGLTGFDGKIWRNNSGTAYGVSSTTGDIVGMYLDLDNNKLYFAKNGTIMNSGTGYSIVGASLTTNGYYLISYGDWENLSSATWEVNFGNPTYSISSGNTDPNGYGNFEYSPNDGGSASFDSTAKDFYALNTKNLAEYG